MTANWTTLYVNLKTKDISLYTGGYEHYKAGELY